MFRIILVPPSSGTVTVGNCLQSKEVTSQSPGMFMRNVAMSNGCYWKRTNMRAQ
jgi:hypothetical protein